MKLGSIVEGNGEVEALRPLINRIIGELRPGTHVEVLQPLRVKRQQVVKVGELERHLSFVGDRTGPEGAILVLLDADDDCAARLAPSLLARAQKARPDRRTVVVLAVAEFEAWLLGSLETLRGHRGIPLHATAPDRPEQLASPKSRLRDLMKGEYQETIDQPALVARLDVASTRRSCPSFDKLVRDLLALIPSAPEDGETGRVS